LTGGRILRLRIVAGWTFSQAVAWAAGTDKTGGFRVSVAASTSDHDDESTDGPAALHWRGEWTLTAPSSCTSSSACSASPAALSLADGCLSVLWTDATWVAYVLPLEATGALRPCATVSGLASVYAAGAGARSAATAAAAASPAKGKRRAKEMQATAEVAMAGTSSCAAVGSKVHPPQPSH
jgi:hypothetical protein